MRSVLLAQALAMMASGILQAEDRPITRDLVRRREPDESFVNPYADENAPPRPKVKMFGREATGIYFNEAEDLERYNKAEQKRQRKAEKRLRAE